MEFMPYYAVGKEIGMTQAQNMLAMLEARRKGLGMSCKALAERSGLTALTVQKVLQGGKNANLSTVLAISQALGAQIGLVRESKLSAVKRRQARAKAHQLAAITQGSAALEAQAVDDDAIKRAERQIEADLLSGPAIRLWA